jgi:hypothetical protein
VIDVPFLMPRGDPTEDQKTFRDLAQRFMSEESQKALAVRSRYGSGKTYFLQQLVREHTPARVLFITYRQTLARDIMRNFGTLGFKNYLDAPDDPRVWNSPKLIVQIDSLLNVMLKNDKFICDGRFDLNYDMIVLDESESLLSHLDEKTMEGKEIPIWNFFDALLKHSKKVVFLDGDMSEKSLKLGASYGDLTYIKNINAGPPKTLNIIQTEKQWETQFYNDLDRFYAEDPGFAVAVASQSSSRAVALMNEIRSRKPELSVRCLTGGDSGETKRQLMENINESLRGVNVFIYSPVIESGVDITIPIKKVFGILCGRSNSQRAYAQMLNRCRAVQEPQVDLLLDPMIKINNNYNFWKYEEVLELNREAVQTTCELLVREGFVELGDNDRNKRRKDISVYNTAERLNKNPTVFLNYLRVLAAGKGWGFQIAPKPEEEEGEAERARRPKNPKVSAILEAPDISSEQYAEMSERKRQGKTTTEENNKCEKHFWQKFLVMSELNEDILKDHLFQRNLFRNFLSLVDLKNHVREDNLRSINLQESVGLVRELLLGLGWGSVVDQEAVMEREAFVTNFVCNIVEHESFRNQKRINELFDLRKTTKIHDNMDTKQMLIWVNSLLKPFALKVSAVDRHGGGYRLEVCSDVLGIVRRKNAKGRLFEDRDNVLKQESPDGDPFVDEATGETLLERRDRELERARREYDTSLLDRGVGGEDDD